MFKAVSLIAVAHFALTFATAFLARGWDLDRLVTRSALSQASNVINAALLLPHDAVVPYVPVSWFMLGRPMAFAMLSANSLLYGLTLYAAWRLLRRVPRRGNEGGTEQHVA